MEMKRMRKKSVLAKLLSLVLCMAMVGSICAPLVAAEEGAVGEAQVIYGEATLVGGGDGGSDTQYADAMEVTALFEQMMRMTDPNELANAIASLTEVQRQLLGEELLRQLEARLYALKVAVNAPILPAPETPAESGTPAGNETPTVPEAPAEEETPAGNEAPAEEETPGAGDELYARLSAITDPAALLLALDSLTEEEYDSLSNEQLDALLDRVHARENVTEQIVEINGEEGVSEVFRPTVNYTWVAPFGAPVAGAPSRRLFSRMFSNFSLRSSEAPSTYGNDGASASSGLELSKTVTADPKGGYTVRLEAYATGATVTTTVTEDVPTDIVLVLDQSGSMAEYMEEYTFTEVTGSSRKNSNLYSKDIYYKLSDGSYVKVSKERTANTSYSYEKADGWDNGDYYDSDYRDRLYQLVDGQYYKVTVTRSGWSGNRFYTYTSDAGLNVSSTGRDTTPNIPNLYIRSETTVYSYTYYYTDADGNRQVITTSEGADTLVTDKVFYTRTATTSSTTRLAALKNAVTNFADSVATKAKGADGKPGTDDDVDHRIAVVGFATGDYSNNSDYPTYENTEVFVGATQYNYNVNAKSHYTDALQDMSTEAGYNNVIASKNALAARGATYPNYGLMMAKGILDANPVSEGKTRNRVVIVFTDGAPGYSSYSSDVATSAIGQATTLKNAGVTVYSVGIFGGADATSAGNSDGNDTQKANWFMQNLSSNNGTPRSPSYYLSASDANGLNSIFQQISNQIQSGGSATTLTESSVIKDIVTPYFQVPAGAGGVSLKVAPCTGKNGDALTWGDEVPANGVSCNFDTTAEGTDKTLSVTGFSFKDNWCGLETTDGTSTPHGKKLIIEFHIVRDPKFLGGNNVPTNGAASGVYVDKDAAAPVDTFDVPHVNEPIYDVTVEVVDKNVYLMDSVTIPQLVAQSTIKCGDITLFNEDGTPATADWQGAYVTITPNSGVTTENLTADTTYTLTATVAPSSDAAAGTPGTAATAMSGTSNTANIRVFKPVITFNDTIINRGDTANYADNGGSLVWKHGDTLDTDLGVKMTGVNYDNNGHAPELNCTYSPEAGAFQSDTPVKVTVKYGAVDVTRYVTFVHDDCNLVRDCIHDASKDQFVVHVNIGSLTITKTFTAENAARLAYIERTLGNSFTITYDNGLTGQDQVKAELHPLTATGEDVWQKSYANGNKTVTYTKTFEVKRGTYTVTEIVNGANTAEVAGFTLTATPTATATVEPRQTAAAALSNSYAIKTGTITVTKTLTGAVPVKATNYVFEITGTTVAGEAVKYYIPVEVPAGQTSASGSISYALYGTYTCTELTPTVGELQSIAGGPLTLNAANPSIGFAATNSFTNHVEYDTDVVNNRFTYKNSSWSWKRVVGD